MNMKQTITCASIWSLGVVDELPIVKDVVEQPTVVVAVLKKVSPETEVKPQRVFFVSQPGFI